MEKLLTNREIAKLNAARDVLNDLAKRTRDASWEATDKHESFNLGKLHEIAENAEHEVFQVLNTAKSYAGLEITDDQMHNRKSEAVTA